MFKIELGKQKFNGPLDLLLSLIQEQEVDISEVSISMVTEQYLEYLEEIEEIDPDELSDFLLIATKLLLLKSRKLLPQLISEEEDGPSLEDQLRLYKKFVQASQELNKLWNDGSKVSYTRVEPVRVVDDPPVPNNFTLENLHDFMVKLIRRIKPLAFLPQAKIDKNVSLKEKIKQIKDLIFGGIDMSFREMLNNANTRTEVIVSFLAILELVKQKTVVLKQNKSFGDILINKYFEP